MSVSLVSYQFTVAETTERVKNQAATTLAAISSDQSLHGTPLIAAQDSHLVRCSNSSASRNLVAMASAIEGRWKLVDSDNFDEYMKEVGVGLITRKAAGALKPTIEIKHVGGDTWQINQFSTFKNTTLEFTLNKEFDETTPDGRTLRSILELKDGKLIHTQKKIKPEDKDSLITRWIEGDKLHVTLQSGNVVSHRAYERE
ncbi:unnamed protein product [Caenorhabditis auriculariae]|uniref:Cytosolic fatty-acid binding proteins domain-containing protein n=1 Tax=Caenorhabditis auriculariae TaxID=2777116 RepID=A0A8S1H6W5_9PELO|nr:unnamed protein product [Caenorhabditis auriculariae]